MGILFKERSITIIENLGVQLFTLRNEMTDEQSVAESFKKIKEIGYDHIQPANFCGIAVERFAAFAKNAGLTAKKCGTIATWTRMLEEPDVILADLRKNKKAMMEKLAPYARFAPSNDIEGDCGTILPIAFESEEAARKFASYEGVRCGLPIDTGKHVFTNWQCIMEKKGAFNPLMDPFKFEANKDIVRDYNADMCKKSLDILSKNVYVRIDPDWTEAELEERANILIAGLKNI